MGSPASADQLRKAFARFGVDNVRWYPGWRRRGFDGFRPRCVVDHHTASPDSENMIKYLANGRGPLCNFGVRKDGQVVVYSLRTVYHGGRGMRSRLDLAARGGLPYDRTSWAPENGSANVNPEAWGIECLKGWDEKFTEAQLDSLIKLNAALCWAQGWGVARVAAHGELTRRKTGDPNTNMGEVRSRTANLLNGTQVRNGAQLGDDSVEGVIMSNQQKFDQLCRDVSEIKRSIRFGRKGEYRDGELAGYLRGMRREVQTILVLIRPGETGRWRDGRIASALRRLLRKNDLGSL